MDEKERERRHRQSEAQKLAAAERLIAEHRRANGMAPLSAPLSEDEALTMGTVARSVLPDSASGFARTWYWLKTRPRGLLERNKVFLELATLLGVGIYTALTGRLVNISKDSMEVGNKAYLVTNGAVIYKALSATESQVLNFPIQPGDGIQILVKFINSGNTPLKNGHLLAVESLRYDFPKDSLATDDPVYKDPNLSEGNTFVLAKGAPFETGGPWRTFTAEQVAELHKPKNPLHLVVFGFLTYEDVFNTPRLTKFCVYYLPEKAMMIPCPSHNLLDDDARSARDTYARARQGELRQGPAPGAKP